MKKTFHNELLKYLYRRHVKTYGRSISNLEATIEGTLMNPFADKFPKIMQNNKDGTVTNKTIHTAMDLEEEGLIQREELEFWLTKKGFERAEQLCHPIKYFCSSHWKFIVSTIAFIVVSILVAVLPVLLKTQ